MSVDQIRKSLDLSIHGTAHTKLSAYIDKVESIGNTIVFRLNRAVPTFLISLRFADLCITDGEVTEATWPPKRFSGPYELISSKEGEFVLRTNSHFKAHKSSLGQHQLTIYGGLNVSQLIDAFVQNKIDGAYASKDQISDSNRVRSREIGLREIETSPQEWTIGFETGKKAYSRWSADERRWLWKKLWTVYGEEKKFGDAPAWGMRPPLQKGALSESSWREFLRSVPDSLQSTSRKPKPLEVFVMKSMAESISYRELKNFLSGLPEIRFEEVIYDPNKRDSEERKRRRAQDYDLLFVYGGLNDPDPDTMWRYMLSDFPGTKPIATPEELDQALFETDPAKRDSLYRVFEERHLKDPWMLSLRMVGSVLFLKPPLAPPAEGKFEWGVQFERLELKP